MIFFLNGMLMTCYQKRYTQLASLNSIGIVWTILLKRRWFRCRNRCISLLSRSRTNLKPVFSSSWQKTDPKKQGVSKKLTILNFLKSAEISTLTGCRGGMTSSFKGLSPTVDTDLVIFEQSQCNLQWGNPKNIAKKWTIPKVGGVWGDLKSKICPKTRFLDRSRLDLIFAKKIDKK